MMTEREALYTRFEDRLTRTSAYNRRTVSFQGNKEMPGFRWMRYKEGFSQELVHRLLTAHWPSRVLDPFAGMGTTPLVAGMLGIPSTGIEIMPIGPLVAEAINHAGALSERTLREVTQGLLKRIDSPKSADPRYAFPHVPITEGAFSRRTEEDLAKARECLTETPGNRATQSILNVACLSVLEDVSFTVKDGQYLRWDARSGRPKAKADKGEIPSLHTALWRKLGEIQDDHPKLRRMWTGKSCNPDFITGSCLNTLRTLPPNHYGMVITSPPYVNRYDYTRTYALELAWSNFDDAGIKDLRQRMLSATVENSSKTDQLDRLYQSDMPKRYYDTYDVTPMEPPTLTAFDHAAQMHQEQKALQEILTTLREQEKQLSNRNIIRMLDGYFLEMALVISEIGRVVRPGGTVIMVNDNVQYHGEEVPVDMILSDFAERSGLRCVAIHTLAKGKGNSSQQMARFGRKEIRKSVMEWVKDAEWIRV